MASSGYSSTSTEDSAREARRKRTIISPRTKIFVQAFMRVHFPAIAAREELAHQTGIPEPRIQVSSPASAWAQDMTLEKGEFSPAKRLELDTHMVSKPKSSAPPAEPKWAQKWLGPKARWHIGHDYSCSRGLKGPICCPEHLSSPSPLSAIEEHASLGSIAPKPQPSKLEKLLVATGILDMQAPSPGSAANAGVHPALPGTPSFLEELSTYTGIPHTFGPSTWASVVAVQQPTLSCTPSLLEEILAAKGISDMPGPSMGPSANKCAPLAIPVSPSLQDMLLASTCILGSRGPSPRSCTAVSGEHQALPRSPSLLEEILAETGIQDMPWASLRATVEEEGVEAILETPLSEDDYQALLDMLPGSTGSLA
nr:PREDICTED: double homeobox protein 4 [Bos mutus]